MIFAGEASWRWKMQRPAADHLYETFWRQAARWLSAPSPDPLMIDVEPDVRPETQATLGVIVRDERFAPVHDAAVELVVRDERGHESVMSATLSDPARGRYTAVWQPSGRGMYKVSAKVTRSRNVGAAGPATLTVSRHLLSGAADRETADPTVHRDVLARLAERTGGQVGRPDDLNALARALRARADSAPTLSVRELWHGPWTFVVVISLLASECGG
jgi:hypothetical protein